MRSLSAGMVPPQELYCMDSFSVKSYEIVRIMLFEIRRLTFLTADIIIRADMPKQVLG